MPENEVKTVSNIVKYAAVSVKYIQIIVTGGTIIVSLINFSIVNKLTPLEQSVGTLINRVEAIEGDRKSVPEWRTRTAILEEKIFREEETIKEIKSDVKEIKNFLLNK